MLTPSKICAPSLLIPKSTWLCASVSRLGWLSPATSAAASAVRKKRSSVRRLTWLHVYRAWRNLVFGAWKDEKHAKAVHEMLMSIRMARK